MRLFPTCFLLILLISLAPKSHAQNSVASHTFWTELLKAHVGVDGKVSYEGFVRDSVKLNAYLSELSSRPPTEKWSEQDQLAYWINAYNAFTIKLVVDYFPVQGIKDIRKGIPFVSSVWDIKFMAIGGQKMSLNDVEHKILRKKFQDPRIHFAIVCASRSCPKLRNEAFVAENLDQQLHEQAVDFINDPDKNHFEEEEIQISSIFNWFEKDFTKEMGLKEYIRKYAKRDFGLYAKVKFLNYDWKLNGE